MRVELLCKRAVLKMGLVLGFFENKLDETLFLIEISDLECPFNGVSHLSIDINGKHGGCIGLEEETGVFSKEVDELLLRTYRRYFILGLVDLG
jgi:hypothetical protein